MTERIYNWFIAPKNSHTNKVVSSRCNPEDYIDGAKCTHGEPLWRFTRELRDDLIRSREELNLNFSIYSNEGEVTPTAKMKNVTFLFKRSMKCKKIKKNNTQKAPN